jgi:hypothetical protein
MSVFSIKFPSFEKASHRTPIRRALSAYAFPNAAIFRRSLFPAKRFFHARRSRGILSWIRRDQLLIVGKVLDCIAFNTSQVPTSRWPIFYCRDRRERDFEVDMRVAISEARFDSVSQGWRITLQEERDERRPVLWGSSRRGQIWKMFTLTKHPQDVDRARQAGDDAPASEDAERDFGPDEYLDYDPLPYERRLRASYAARGFCLGGCLAEEAEDNLDTGDAGIKLLNDVPVLKYARRQTRLKTPPAF